MSLDLKEYILELKNIGKTFSGVNVLRNINLKVMLFSEEGKISFMIQRVILKIKKGG